MSFGLPIGPSEKTSSHEDHDRTHDQGIWSLNVIILSIVFNTSMYFCIKSIDRIIAFFKRIQRAIVIEYNMKMGNFPVDNQYQPNEKCPLANKDRRRLTRHSVREL